ncbi:MAG: hypothetical protein AMS27_06890 [Bacteroides sp. SM23_62_1]|nr:MAG: hypothetical protein AMS27_06890 [Bacteroides sp. SM23_62_1]
MTVISLAERNLKFVKVKQEFTSKKIPDIEAHLNNELSRFKRRLTSGMEIAIAVGSRGITDHLKITREVIRFLDRSGVRSFIIPAMGSHGGATAHGQQEILEGYGISEKNLGVPVRSGMEVVNISNDPDDPVFIDKAGWQSDGIILINRIKPHTDFSGTYESGLVKMAVIGLGNHQQAEFIHGKGVEGLEELVPRKARKIFDSGKILGGIAIIEDACDQTMDIRALLSNEIMDTEPRLLKLAREHTPGLPLDVLDVLFIDRMGKDISGVGMDPHVLGRLKIPGYPEPDRPHIRSVIACDLTPDSHGNGLGIGLADVITRKLFNKIELEVMYRNVYTSTFVERVKIPIIAENEKQALEFALRNCGEVQKNKEIILRIRDTKHLNEFWVSTVAMEKLKAVRNIIILSEPVEMFKDNGELIPF